MGWLTVKAIELDRAESLARRQAELEEAVGRALWRMDVKLMPHLAREAARPHAVYSSLLTATDAQGRSSGMPQLSPLLTDRSEFVWVNYQVEPGDVWSSPQAPNESIQKIVCPQGVSPQEIAACTTALSRLSGCISYEKISASLPVESNPEPNSPGQQTLLRNPIVDLDRVAPSSRSADVETQQQQLEQIVSTRSRVNTSNDFFNRNAAVNSYAQEAVSQQMPAFQALKVDAATEGVSQPIWVDNQLLLARRVDLSDKVVIQGCWLDWEKIRTSLVEEVRDVLPDVTLEPVTDSSQAQVGRMLATLPVQLVAHLPEIEAVAWSAMQVSLAMAWACVLIAAVAAGVLLHGVLTLSERRGAFVSAVTHELRTPLTTFRMYSEMLANDMVPEPAKRQSYLDTLRVEADRLSHLVENVLSYAKLERGPQRHRREQLSVASLLDRVGERLADRTRQADMQFVVEATAAIRETSIKTDPAAAEQILFNLVDNACKYAARANDRRIHLDVHVLATSVAFQVRDHGRGISPREAKLLFRPFSKSADEAAHSAPGVGLGLALCRRLAHDLGGQLELVPIDDAGAVFQLTLPR